MSTPVRYNGSRLSSYQANGLFSQITQLMFAETSITEKLVRARQVLESLYKYLTENLNIAFTGLYPRMQYVEEAATVTPGLMEQLHFLRLLTNKIVHNDPIIMKGDEFHQAVKVLAEAIVYFSDLNCPANISHYLDEHSPQALSTVVKHKENNITSLFGTVLSWKASPPQAGVKYLEIVCQTFDGAQVTVTLWERREQSNPGKQWTVLDKVIWKYCHLGFYELSAIQGMSNRYQSTPQTLVIVEQDFLVDVSAVADCFQNSDYYPELFFINRFFSEPVSAPLAKGKLVNHVFDELIYDPSLSLDEILSAYEKSNSFLLYSLGEETWQGICKTVREDHFPQLKRMADILSRGNCQLEPSFISPHYGLHGRLDVIILPDAYQKKYSIIELKSGSVPSTDVWKSHQMQVVGYNLILKDTFGADKLASSSIFYSRHRETPLRHVKNHVMAEQDFLMCRNRIIGLMQTLATQPELFLTWLKTTQRRYESSFLNDKAELLRGAIGKLTEEQLIWVQEQLSFVFKEIWAAKTGAFEANQRGSYGYSALWNCSNVEKKNQYGIMEDLWVEDYSEDTITFLRKENDAVCNLRENDIILIYNQMLPVNNQRLLRGTIVTIDDAKLTVRTRSKIKDNAAFDSHTVWAIEPDLMEASLYGSLPSLFHFISSDAHKKDILMGRVAPHSEPVTREAMTWRPDVCVALSGMIAARDYYAVQGPPGTGKTSCLLLQYVLYVLHETQHNAVILSYTNRAVDEICRHLHRENIRFLRLNSGQKHEHHSTGTKAQQDAYERRIVVGTLHSFTAVAPDLMQRMHFDELIVDEASQILTHQIIGWMSVIPKTILIGDQHQLPPVVLHDAQNTETSVFDYILSIQNRQNDYYAMLTNHYRMHDEIAHLVNPYYADKLVSASKRQNEKKLWLDNAEELLREILQARLIWVDTLAADSSKLDNFQAAWIRRFIKLLSGHMTLEQIVAAVGIISPFRAQVQCIRATLPETCRSITVDTVERFQGSERDCIILSYPVRYPFELGMVQSLNADGSLDRKLNVALTRAREQLIILGNHQVLMRSPHFNHIYIEIKKKGFVIPYSMASQFIELYPA